MMRGIGQDIRFALRLIAKEPGFAAVVVITLALGIGANTAIFSGVHHALLQTIEASEPGELVWIATREPGQERESITHSYDLYEELKRIGSPLRGVAAFAGRATAVGVDGVTEQRVVELATADFFPLLGADAVLGRVFGADDTDEAVAVLSHGFWRDRLAADPNVLGREVTVTGKPYRVIGVMAEGFAGPSKGSASALWIPMEQTPSVLPGFDRWATAGWQWMHVVARLEPDADREQAAAAAQVALSRHVEHAIEQWSFVDAEQAERARARRVELPAAAYGVPYTVQRAEETLTLLGGVVGLILLLACANVANLMLGRGSVRRQEIAMRLALGSGRARVVRQLLVESMVLAALGGAAGALVAWYSTDLVAAQLDTGAALELSLPVLGFTAAVSVLAGVLFGLLPAWTASDVSLSGWLKSGVLGDRERGWGARGVLVAAQAALCLPVLVAAGLLLETLNNLYSVSTGMAVEQVVQATLDPSASGYSEERGLRVTEEIEERLRARPEIAAVGMGHSTTFTGWTSGREVYRAESDDVLSGEAVNYGSVSPGYFEAVGVALLSGRAIEETDTAEAPDVLVVNEAFARTAFDGENPVGRRVRLDRGTQESHLIVGLVADSVHNGLRQEVRPFMYRALAQAPAGRVTYYARVRGSAAAGVALVRAEAGAVDGDLPLLDARPLTEAVERSVRAERRMAGLLSAFGAVGLALAAVGLYGVLSYMVARRTREMGLRKALGARPLALAGMLIRRGLAWTVAGVAAGTLAAWWARGVIATQLFGVEAGNPWVFAAAGATLLMAATAAAWTPARRAARVEPMEALRHE